MLLLKRYKIYLLIAINKPRFYEKIFYGVFVKNAHTHFHSHGPGHFLWHYAIALCLVFYRHFFNF